MENQRAKVITFAFQKGGIAKTTSTSNLAAGLKKMGKDVLVIDLDTQGSISAISGAQTDGVKSLTDVLKKECTAQEAIQHLPLYDILPASTSLIAFQETMPSITNKDFLLTRTVIKQVANDYDYILIDTNPSFCDLSKNAIVAADDLIIPINADKQSYASLAQQIATINAINEAYEMFKKPTRIAGILVTMFHERDKIDREYDKLIKDYAESKGIRVFDSHIRYSTAIKQSQAELSNIFDARSNSSVAQDYFNFIKEYIEQED